MGSGWARLIQRVGASSPGLIARNLRLENLTIIKFMATTIAVGGVIAYTLGLFVPMHWDIKPLYLIGVVLGGTIFAVGFAVGGTVPARVWLVSAKGARTRCSRSSAA